MYLPLRNISHKFLRMLTGCVLVASAAGCTDDAPDDTSGQLPVIEASISSDGYPYVFFTSSVKPGIDGTIADNIVKWGKVTISDGENEVVMTAGPDPRYMPPYRYYTFNMRGRVGRTYTITATYAGMKATATATIPSPTPIDSIVLSQTMTDSLRAATLYFTAPQDVPAYYYLTINETDRTSQPLPCMLGNVRTDRPGERISIPVMHARLKIDSLEYVPQLKVGERLEVHLNRVSREVYEFWKAYDNMVNFSTSPFITTDQSLPTNVSGGYGVFSAQGQSTVIVDVK